MIAVPPNHTNNRGGSIFPPPTSVRVSPSFRRAPGAGAADRAWLAPSRVWVHVRFALHGAEFRRCVAGMGFWSFQSFSNRFLPFSRWNRTRVGRMG